MKLISGEWWNADPNDVESAAQANGSVPANSDAYTINGWPGDLFNSCVSTSKWTKNCFESLINNSLKM